MVFFPHKTPIFVENKKQNIKRNINSLNRKTL